MRHILVILQFQWKVLLICPIIHIEFMDGVRFNSSLNAEGQSTTLSSTLTRYMKYTAALRTLVRKCYHLTYYIHDGKQWHFTTQIYPAINICCPFWRSPLLSAAWTTTNHVNKNDYSRLTKQRNELFSNSSCAFALVYFDRKRLSQFAT